MKKLYLIKLLSILLINLNGLGNYIKYGGTKYNEEKKKFNLAIKQKEEALKKLNENIKKSNTSGLQIAKTDLENGLKNLKLQYEQYKKDNKSDPKNAKDANLNSNVLTSNEQKNKDLLKKQGDLLVQQTKDRKTAYENKKIQKKTSSILNAEVLNTNTADRTRKNNIDKLNKKYSKGLSGGLSE